MDVNVTQLIHRGRAAFDRREYEAALADFREVLGSHPHFADVRNLAGLCHGYLGRPEEALEEFDRAIALNAHYVEAHLNRAITLNDLGRHDEASEAFHFAGRLEVDERGRFPAAVSARLANAHADVGDLYIAAAAPADAAEQFRIALELRPRFHDIRNKLARALIQLGDLEGAKKELETVLEGNQEFTAARLNLGLVYHHQGNTDAAAEEWRRVAENEPDHPQVRAYLTMLEAGAVAHGASPRRPGQPDEDSVDGESVRPMEEA